ncbi:glycosyltransferase [Salinicoccus sp. HZC-1]|uniref:glycosyltransferase n=1 Tax=Salinicoccus sp. HZC-1 TaxID=3385497 RepID=UPI00398B73B8
MKIVHITPSLAGGGAERMISKISEYDDKNEHVIITLLDMEQHYEIKESNIIALKAKKNIFSKILLITRLKKNLKKLDPDIVQTWLKANFYVPFLKGFSDIKIISSFRNGYNGYSNKFMIFWYNKLLNIFEGHIFVSNSALNERLKVGLIFNNSTVITNGFEIPDYNKIIKNNTLVIGHMGRFHKVKNQQLIIDIFKEFSIEKETELVLAGKNLSENLNFTGIPLNKLKLMGEIKNIDEFYKEIDVFILTSDSEGFPNVVGEAMSYGIPVISTNAGDSHKIIGTSGFPIFKKEEIFEILEMIYEDREILKNKSLLSRNKIKNEYSLLEIIHQYQEYYRHIGGKK